MPLLLWMVLAALTAFVAGVGAGAWLAHRRLEQRLAQAAHELRTPLTAILGFSDIARARLFGPLPDRYAEQAELTHEAAAHLLATADAVLDADALSRRALRPRLEAFDAREVVDGAVGLMAARAVRAGVALRSDLPDQPAPILADRRMLGALAHSLIDNALKATARGGEVRVRLRHSSTELRLEVIDTGGVQVPAVGWGKGLKIARGYARAHDGNLVLSRAGQGFIACARLPAARARA